MNRSGHNPARRNRNIGTAKSGSGRDNRLVIPWAWTDNRVYYNRLVDPVRVEINVRSFPVPVIVEPPLNGFFHACTLDDLARILNLLPFEHIRDIQAFVFRQPKRKERILAPAWGRLVYWTDICGHSGPVVYLESQEPGKAWKWKKSLAPDDADELDRLRLDGHRIETDQRHHTIHFTQESVRNTQLYRTLPHEIGHYADYLTKVENPCGQDHSDWSERNDRYHARPSMEKEAFAHRYADAFRERNRSQGHLPFERLFDPANLKRMGLKPIWFDPEAI
ncbi:MAG: hypothetical protein AAF514_06090 [Verrucomicrobiota bacterium]